MNIVVANGFGMEQCSFYSEEYHCCVLHNTRCKCEDYNPRNSKPLTNYDRLICKTPEELADFVAKALYGMLGGQPCLVGEGFEDCKNRWLNWLKQEVK